MRFIARCFERLHASKLLGARAGANILSYGGFDSHLGESATNHE